MVTVGPRRVAAGERGGRRRWSATGGAGEARSRVAGEAKQAAAAAVPPERRWNSGAAGSADGRRRRTAGRRGRHVRRGWRGRRRRLRPAQLARGARPARVARQVRELRARAGQGGRPRSSPPGADRLRRDQQRLRCRPACRCSTPRAPSPARDCVHTTTTGTGSATITGDVVLPSQPQRGGKVVLIDRGENTALTFVDPATCTFDHQISVKGGFNLSEPARRRHPRRRQGLRDPLQEERRADGRSDHLRRRRAHRRSPQRRHPGTHRSQPVRVAGFRDDDPGPARSGAHRGRARWWCRSTTCPETSPPTAKGASS